MGSRHDEIAILAVAAAAASSVPTDPAAKTSALSARIEAFEREMWPNGPAHGVGSGVRFCAWLLDLMGYVEGDTVDDLYPGTGVMGRVLAARLTQTRTLGEAE